MNKLATFFRETSAGRFLIGAGIILIIFGCIVRSIAKDTSNYTRTDAVVTKTELSQEADEEDDTEALYTVDVKYTVDGVEYEEEYGEFAGYKEGDQVTIAYNPKNPREIAQPGTSKNEGYLFILAGAAALAAGIFSLVRAAQKHNAMKEQEKEWNNG